MAFRTPYDGKRKRVATSFKGTVSAAVQDQKDSTDINNILRRFQATGLIEHVNKYEPQYGEFSQYDYHENLTKIREVEQAFGELPSSVRNEFDNDPQQWIEHIANPDNVDDMRDGEIDNEIAERSEEQGANATGNPKEGEAEPSP